MALILFDVDGTLVDSRRLILEAKKRAFAAHDLPLPDADTLLAVVGLTPEDAFDALVGPERPAAAMASTYRDVWHAIRTDADFAEALFPGAATMIEELAQSRHRLGIVTGRSASGVDHMLVREGWQTTFCTIQTEEVAPSKPHPGMVLRALAETGAMPSDTVVVGDTSFDMQMARNAGVRAIGVDWGYHRAERLLADGAEMIASDMSALGKVLLAL